MPALAPNTVDSFLFVHAVIAPISFGVQRSTFVHPRGNLGTGLLRIVAISDKMTLILQVKSFKNLTLQGALHRLQNYYKFAIVRHPLERLLSAYRNKLESRLIYEQRRLFPAHIQAFILSHFRREEYRAWLSSWHTLRNSSQTTDIHPTFQEFVQFMALFPLNEYNEHFSPFLELCHPCAIHYDFYANFKTLHYDLYALMNYLTIPPSYYPSITSYYSTRLLMKEYFGQLSSEDKRHLYHKFRHELDFYCSLHPEEQYSHNHL